MHEDIGDIRSTFIEALNTSIKTTKSRNKTHLKLYPVPGCKTSGAILDIKTKVLDNRKLKLSQKRIHIQKTK